MNPSHCTMLASPTLNLDLVGPVLTLAVRLASSTHVPSCDQPHPLVAILTVLPRMVVPTVSHAAILAMPWIDSDAACKLGDTWLLDTLHFRLARAPACRPVHFVVHAAIEKAARAGHVHVLDWLETRVGVNTQAHHAAVLLAACESGHVQVLQWWIENGNKKDFGKNSMLAETASQSQHVAILERLQASGFALSVQCCALSDLVLNRKMDLANWWIRHEDMANYPKYLADRALVSAMVTGDGAILDSLLQFERFQERMTLELAAFACATGDLEFVEHCHLQVNGGLGATSTKHKLCYVVASAFGRVHVLEWLVADQGVPHGDVRLSGWEWLYLAKDMKDVTDVVSTIRVVTPFTLAIVSGSVSILDWLVAHSFTCSPETEKHALRLGSANVLTWMQAQMPNLFATVAIKPNVNDAFVKGKIDVLDWWMQHAGKQRLAEVLYRGSVGRAPLHVWKWWKSAGLPLNFPCVSLSKAGVSQTAQSSEVWTWLLDNGKLPDDYLSDWIQTSSNLAVLNWAKEHGLIERLFETGTDSGRTWPLNTHGFFLHGWPVFMWWMENGAPEFVSRLQRQALCFPNPLMMDVCRQVCHGRMAIDGNYVSAWGAVPCLEWGRLNDVPILETCALKLATGKHRVDVLEWWQQHGQNVRVPRARSVAKRCRGDVGMWNWWVRSGLLEDLDQVTNFLGDFGPNVHVSDDSEISDS